MALQGTVKDFALPDIFQLIGIQRKTGILTLENGDDTVTLKFLEGQVVGADTQSESIEDRLGELLVRTGRISQGQLQEALATQKSTLQRLGYILVSSGHISEEDLVEALRVQSSQIIYRLFRWHEGTYHFDRVEDLEYDQNHFVPISSETILMEGARMIDEWPIIERRIRSDRVVLRKTAAAEALAPKVESILEQDIDFNLGFEFDRPPDDAVTPDDEETISVSAEEREVLSFVDGRRSVREICDLLTLGEFDTHRILSDMITRNLLEEVRFSRDPSVEVEKQRLPSRIVGWLAHAALVALVLVALGTLRDNPLTPWRLLAADRVTDHLRRYASMARLERIENAVQIFYLDSGTFPKSMAALAQNGYLKAPDLHDPWGRPYQFRISSGGYELSGLDGEGQPSPDLTVSRRFSTVQRMMLAEADATEP